MAATAIDGRAGRRIFRDISQEELSMRVRDEAWPALPLADWRGTCETLHRWTQIVGKLCLARPRINHWWQVALQVTARGLATPPIPDGDRTFDLEFDLVEHRLIVRTSDGASASLPLAPRSVASFYSELLALLRDPLGIDVAIWPVPVEVPDPIPFPEDRLHRDYDPAWARRFQQVIAQSHRVLERFRARFVGKASPVHFFWGTFDLTLGFYSGRTTSARKDADPITRESYTHEVMSFGFWPGGGLAGGIVDDAAYYSYTFPQPEALPAAPIRPEAARWEPRLGEFILPYEDVRRAASPEAALGAFLESAWISSATLAGFDRARLERAVPSPRAAPERPTLH
jgi:hypothetical protein